MQLAGHDMLKCMGIALIPASAPDYFTADTPTAVLVPQVLGAIAEFDKASTVAKLAEARKRKREATGKCEGRKGQAELRPAVLKLERELRHAGDGWKPKSGVLSLRSIAAELPAAGHVNEAGRPYNPKSIAAMLA